LEVVQEMLQALGLEKERFRLVWCSSAEAERFAAAVRDMTAKVRSLGPSPYRPDQAAQALEGEVASCR
jgi:F420-non-reducing hydrogenase iron-sulfur subunit